MTHKLHNGQSRTVHFAPGEIRKRQSLTPERREAILNKLAAGGVTPQELRSLHGLTPAKRYDAGRLIAGFYPEIAWGRAKLAEFKKLYLAALADPDVWLRFEGRSFSREWAGYLIEYLEKRLEKNS